MNESLFQGNLVTSNRILYTPSAFARANLLHLQETGTLQAKQPHTSKRTNLNSYLFFIVEHGSGTLEYNKHQYFLHSGDCVFIDCSNSYAHCTDAQDLWKLHWVHFYGPTMPQIYKKYLERSDCPYFHPHNIDLFLNLIEELYQIANSDEYVKDMSIQANLASLLTLIMKESWHQEQSRRSSPKKQTLLSIQKYLDDHYTDKIVLDELSEKFFINKFYLTRIFKEQYGTSINNYLYEKRITHAKQLLRFTDEPIEKLCATCGIDDANYFTRLFKKIEGITPGEYRKTWQG